MGGLPLDVYTHTYKDLQKGRSAIVFGEKLLEAGRDMSASC